MLGVTHREGLADGNAELRAYQAQRTNPEPRPRESDKELPEEAEEEPSKQQPW